MDRPSSHFSSLQWFAVWFMIWIIEPGIASSQPQPPEPPDTIPAVQEENTTSEEQGEVMERGIRRGNLGSLPGLLPPKTTPSSSPAPNVFTPSVGKQSAGGTPPIIAPIPSLTAVANGIQLTHKSLTTLLKVIPNLPVTVPIEISVGYFSSTASQRLTQTYKAETGNLMLYNDAEGDGKPRTLRLDISLRELIPGGGNFSFIRPITMEPLYDVTISPLRFSLRNNCDLAGKSEIILRWFSPDGHERSIPKFKTFAGETKRIPEFAWSVREVSTRNNFTEPVIMFHEDDLGLEYKAPLSTGDTMLVAGKRQSFELLLNEGSARPTTEVNPRKCQANVTYNISRLLLKFTNLP